MEGSFTNNTTGESERNQDLVNSLYLAQSKRPNLQTAGFVNSVPQSLAYDFPEHQIFRVGFKTNRNSSNEFIPPPKTSTSKNRSVMFHTSAISK